VLDTSCCLGGLRSWSVGSFVVFKTAKGASMLWELQVAEQRYGAVRKVLDGASVIEVARRFGCRGRACMPGCAGMPLRVGWAVWVIGRHGRTPVRTRRARWWRPGSWGSGERTRPGVQTGSVISSRKTGSARCRAGRVCIGRWCGMVWWRRSSSAAAGRTTSAGSGAGRGAAAARDPRADPH
jgi:hypothetical protein